MGFKLSLDKDAGVRKKKTAGKKGVGEYIPLFFIGP